MQPETPSRESRAGSRRTVLLYYGFQFAFSLLVWLPVFYEYQKRIGLDDSQIFHIQSIYYLLFCLLEIPTGLFADLWGYLLCMRAGALVLIAANLLPIFFPSYPGFLAHFVLIALSRSLISGASSAYLYNHLSSRGAPADFKQIEGRARAYSLIGKVVCWSAVGPLMAWHLTLPYWSTVVFASLSLAFAFRLPAEGVHTGSSRSEGLLLPLKALRELAVSPFMLFIMIQGIAIFVLGRIVQVNLFQPILSAKSVGLAGFGLVMSLMTLFEALGSAYPGWVRRYLADVNAVFVLTAAMAGSLALMVVGGKVAAVALLCVFSLACGFAYPIQRQLLNDAITDDGHRATLMSIESIIDRAVCAWVAAVLARALGGPDRLSSFLLSAAEVTMAGVVVLAALLRLQQAFKIARRRQLA